MFTKASGGITVDDADYLSLKDRPLYKSGEYAATKVDGQTMTIQRLLMRPAKGQWVAFKNGNKLDCRRRNLVVCTPARAHAYEKLSSNNTSGFKGVSYNKARSCWQAYIRVNRRRVHLGYHASLAEAITARRMGETNYLSF